MRVPPSSLAELASGPGRSEVNAGARAVDDDENIRAEEMRWSQVVAKVEVEAVGSGAVSGATREGFGEAAHEVCHFAD